MSEIAQESASSRSRTSSRTSSSRLITPYPKTGSDDSADRTPPSTNRLALAHQVPRPLPSRGTCRNGFISFSPPARLSSLLGIPPYGSLAWILLPRTDVRDFLFPSNHACLPALFRYRSFHFEPIPGRLRDPVQFQLVKAGIALPSHVGREPPCGVRYGASGG